MHKYARIRIIYTHVHVRVHTQHTRYVTRCGLIVTTVASKLHASGFRVNGSLDLWCDCPRELLI